MSKTSVRKKLEKGESVYGKGEGACPEFKGLSDDVKKVPRSFR